MFACLGFFGMMVLWSSSAFAIDTTENYDPGFTDFELYSNFDINPGSRTGHGFDWAMGYNNGNSLSLWAGGSITSGGFVGQDPISGTDVVMHVGDAPILDLVAPDLAIGFFYGALRDDTFGVDLIMGIGAPISDPTALAMGATLEFDHPGLMPMPYGRITVGAALSGGFVVDPVFLEVGLMLPMIGTRTQPLIELASTVDANGPTDLTLSVGPNTLLSDAFELIPALWSTYTPGQKLSYGAMVGVIYTRPID